MFKASDFRISNDNRWIYLMDKEGNVVRKFDGKKRTVEDVRLFRDGYVKGLNAAS